MTPERPEFRLSDAERQDALDALGEHMRSGRLDIDEYADRTAKVTVAKTRGELISLFSDLPEPRPAILREHLPSPPGPTRVPARPRGAWLASAAVPIAGVLAILMFFTVARGVWLVFLIPAAIALLVGSLYRSGPRGGGY